MKLWDNMIDDMNDRIASVLMRGQIPEIQQQEVKEAAPEEHQQRFQEQKESIEEKRAREMQRAAASHDTREGASQVNHTPYVAEHMPRPNDPCPCGSGKKFKNCHGRNIR